MDALVDTSRINTGVDLEQSDALDAELAEFLSEMRLIKDDHELSELRGSVESTIRGFEDIVRAIPAATQHTRGERSSKLPSSPVPGWKATIWGMTPLRQLAIMPPCCTGFVIRVRSRTANCY